MFWKESQTAKLSSVSELYECMKYIHMQRRPSFKYTNSKTLNKYLQHIYWLSNIYCLHILFIYLFIILKNFVLLQIKQLEYFSEKKTFYKGSKDLLVSVLYMVSPDDRLPTSFLFETN